MPFALLITTWAVRWIAVACARAWQHRRQSLTPTWLAENANGLFAMYLVVGLSFMIYVLMGLVAFDYPQRRDWVSLLYVCTGLPGCYFLAMCAWGMTRRGSMRVANGTTESLRSSVVALGDDLRRVLVPGALVGRGTYAYRLIPCAWAVGQGTLALLEGHPGFALEGFLLASATVLFLIPTRVRLHGWVLVSLLAGLLLCCLAFLSGSRDCSAGLCNL
jgi:hypothetical protein